MVDFSQYENRYGLPSGYLARTMQIESGGDVNARNPNSSAKGPFQFIDSTAKAYGLENPFDLEASTDAAARLARDNASILRKALGREPTAAELYLAHQQGGGGATKLLANMDAPAVDVVGENAIRLNAGDPNMTAADFAGLWMNKYEQTPNQQRAAGYERRAGDTSRLALEAYKAGDMTKSEAVRFVSEELLDGIEPEEGTSFMDRLGDAAVGLDFAGVGQAPNMPRRLTSASGVREGDSQSGTRALQRFGLESLVRPLV
jgi:hypothetical protein